MLDPFFKYQMITYWALIQRSFIDRIEYFPAQCLVKIINISINLPMIFEIIFEHDWHALN